MRAELLGEEALRDNQDKPHSKYPHVYAIVRFDSSVSTLENNATVVKVLPLKTMAEQEVARLKESNKGKRSVYTVQTTRFAHSAMEEGCPAGVAANGTVAGLGSVRLAIPHSPPCVPLLHRHYPVSSLL